MNKKAAATREFVPWIGYLFLTIIVIVFIFVIVYDHLNMNLNTEAVQDRLMLIKLIYSPSCLAYEDPDLGVQQGKIDITKLAEGRVKNCLEKDKTKYTLFLLDSEKTLIKKVENMDINYEMQVPVCSTVSNYFKCSLDISPVLYYNNSKLTQGYLAIGVIRNVQ